MKLKVMDNNKKNIKRLEKNNKSEIIKNASKNTSRILFNAFIKSNPALDSVIGSDGLNLMNKEERRIKNVSEIKSSTKNLIKSIKSSSKENDIFSEESEELSNSKPEYETITEIIDNDDGTKSEIINVSDKKKSSLVNSPLIAFNNLATINQKGFTGTNIALRNLAISNEATSTLMNSAVSNLASIQSSIYQNTLLEENTKRGKQSKLFEILNGNISLLKYLDNKTNIENNSMISMLGGSEGLKNILMGFAKNPIELALTTGAQMGMKKLMYGSTSGYDPDDVENKGIFSRLNRKFDPNNLGSLLVSELTDDEGRLSNTLDKLKGNDNKYISNLGEALNKRIGNLKDNVLSDGTISTKNKRDKSTPVQFDRESHTSINKAIPDLLSRLQGNLIAKREGKSNGLVNNSELGSIYNYSEGTWDSRENTRKNINDKLKEKSLFNFKDTKLGKDLSDNGIEDEEIKDILLSLSKINKPVKNKDELSKHTKDINYSDIIENIFNNDISKFNIDLFNIKKSIGSEYNKIGKDDSTLMSFTDIKGLKRRNNETQSSSARVNKINEVKDYSDIEWKNDDLDELKKLFLEIESKLDDINPENISNNKDYVNDKIGKINSIIDSSSKFNLPSYLSNEKTKSVQDKLGKLSSSVNKFNDMRKDPSSILRENTNNNGNNEDHNSGIIDNNYTDNHPLMNLIKNIKGPQSNNKVDLNKEPTKSIDDLSREEKQSKARKYLENLISTAYPKQSKTMINDMNQSDDNKKLDEMKKGLSTANAAETGEDVISKLSGSSKTKVAEDLRGTLKFGSGGAAEKETGTKKLMNSMLDFSKPGTIAFAGLSATVLAKLMNGKRKKDQEKGLMGSVGTGLGFLGKAGLMLGGGAIAAKFLPKILKKFLPEGAMKMLDVVRGLPGKVKGAIGKVVDIGKNFYGKTKNLIKGIGNLGKNIFGKTVKFGKGVFNKTVKFGKGAFNTGASVVKWGAKKLPKVKSFAVKGLTKTGKFLGKGFKKASSIGKGIFSSIKNGGKKTFGFLGKAKNKLFSKGGMKAAGKFALKAGLKTALPFIPIVGPIIGAAMWAPDIIKTIKHPIESLKHPIKTLGSFFGLSKHPGDNLEAREKEEKENEDETGLGRLILSTSKMMFRSSPLFPISKVGGDMFKTITDNKMKSGPKAEEEIQENMFYDTPLGSLYQIAKGGIDFSTKGGGEIGDWFARFLVKMEEMVVAMSKMKNSSSGGDSSSSSGSSSGQLQGDEIEIDKNAPSITSQSVLNKIPDNAAGAWIKKHQFWQPFGNYQGLSFNGSSKHWGIDIGMPTGTDILAIVPGTVSNIIKDVGGGNIVEVKNGSIYTWYMHNSKITAKKGDKVGVGQKIAVSGNTGAQTTAPHMHFQVMKGRPSNETAIDPAPYVFAKVKGKGSDDDDDKSSSKGGSSKKGEKDKGGGHSLVGDMNSVSMQRQLKKKSIQDMQNRRKEIAQQKREQDKINTQINRINKQDDYKVKEKAKKVNKVFNAIKESKEKKQTGILRSSNQFNKILIIGDEITKDASNDLRIKIKGAKIEASVGKQYSGGSESGRRILQNNIDEYNRTGVAIVIQLGLNGGLSTGEISEIQNMYDKANVYFVNTYFNSNKNGTSLDLTDLMNAVNESINASAANIIDWFSKANSVLVKEDGYMPTNKGRMILVDLIKMYVNPYIGGGGSSDDKKAEEKIDKEVEKEKSKADKKDNKDEDEKGSESKVSKDEDGESSDSDSSDSSSGSGAGEYSFKNGTWYGSITGRDDRRMDEEEQEELNDRLMKRYAKIYGIDYEEAKKIDKEQQEELKAKAGKEATESGSSSGSSSSKDGDDKDSGSSASSSKDKAKENIEKAGSQISKLGNGFQLPTLENSGFSNSNKSTQNNQGNTSNNTTNNNYNQGQGSTVNNTDVKQEFVKGKNKTTNHYNKIVNNYKNSTVTNGNTDYIYDYEQYWYSDDLVKMLSNIDRNTLASTKELDRLLEELK
ncbi:tape measure protein [Staphylococcus phage Machias]|nr:tape measure protein [Staphylococcus phage Machias]